MGARRWGGVLFDHDRLEVYGVAVAFLALANRITERRQRGRGYLRDQLNRAALSIVTNTAEGAGEMMPGEKARFYRMACRSATECASILDAYSVLGACDPAMREEGRRVLHRIVSMLTVLAKRHQAAA